MTMQECELDGVELRVLRASFSGELGYEINLPDAASHALIERLWALAPRFGAVPYGIEALEILRTEKGYIHVGTDTDGTTLPGDIGFGRAIERKACNWWRCCPRIGARGCRWVRKSPPGRRRR